MKLYYYKDYRGNFGDDLNPWLWSKLLPEFFDDDERTIFVGIGTLLNSLLPREAHKVVFSTGVGYLEPPPPVDDSWRIFCVRGPLSAARLGVDKSLAITDGAALLRTIEFPSCDKRYGVSFIPHHGSHRPKWSDVCRMLGINYIDPSKDVDFVLSEIRKSKLIIAEAMHGAIVADTLRVPWIPVKFHQHILDFKWQDWCQSLGLRYQPITLPRFLEREYANKYCSRCKYTLLSFYVMWISHRVKPVLSSEDVLDSAVERLLEKLELLRKNVVS